ncbi:MAG: phosphorylase [Janthinobacterium lividum]
MARPDLPPRGRIGILVGLAAEARIAAPLGCRVAIGGGTATGAEAAVRQLIEAGATALVSFGLAGGLDPDLPPGTLLVPQTLLLDGDDPLATDAALCAWLGGATHGPLFCGTAIVADVAGKRALHARTGAAAVDLESGAVARAAARHGLASGALRAVCDPAERDLPPAALAALDSAGAIGAARVLGSVLRRPAQVPALLRLARDAAAAQRALRERVRLIAAA